ncbi:MAG TPA: type II toxin-antitoxin system VapC family toxin [Pararhizobium sp.]|uniref:type II toxin-antitoxin system VapC family toxin n=1 Tax=Pararhizobium sp. TaxID=1977563 RepID=UPI002CC9FDB8|nr:type II toxin-antitoxin system VapC family toxin [Pararhizobium sp.]HTO33859.1 type II toxin-antitoxin system VapC family toxin [Pararhizobium sp.]
MILLDTHVLVWAVHDDVRLGKKARAIIEECTRNSRILISAITPWEIAMLTEKERLVLGDDVGRWIDRVLALPGISLAALEPQISIGSVRLPGEFHPDPADRIIVATARFHQVPLMTADQAILDYGAKGHVATFDAAS